MLDLCRERAQQWAAMQPDDAATQQEINRLLAPANGAELVDAFHAYLEFGTGGLRGIMGVGTNRMNTWVVRQATQGLALYLRRQFAELKEIKVVIGCDSRHNSQAFSEAAAQVLSAHGIRVFLFDSMRPTPEVSFAIRHLGCQAGINVTASHNPKEYNGYKVYWEDGAQVVAPHDRAIIAEVKQVQMADIPERYEPSLITRVGEEIDQAYIAELVDHFRGIDPAPLAADLKIVYTPLHGAGMHILPRALEAMGCRQVVCVKEQMTADGDFPTVKSPNPDNVKTLQLAFALAQRETPDLLLASDPDADRLSAAARDAQGEWRLLDGHQTCMLMFYYLLEQHRQQGLLRPDHYLVRTIVTSDLVARMADDYGVQCFDTYIGFKWIAEVMRDQEGRGHFLAGAEESYGFLPYGHVRDKDAVGAAVLMAKVADWAKAQGLTLFELVERLYERYGYVHTTLSSLHKPGADGAEEIRALLARFREERLTTIAGEEVVVMHDFKQLRSFAADGQELPIAMSAATNMLQWKTKQGTKITLRPSGTEPKIRFYIEVHLPAGLEAAARHELAQERVKAIQAAFGIG